jgi:hypothetical protein
METAATGFVLDSSPEVDGLVAEAGCEHHWNKCVQRGVTLSDERMYIGE